jgi:beta-glucosidase
LNSTDLKTASNDPSYGTTNPYPAAALSSAPQPAIPAGGAPGGNPQLYDVLYTVRATVTNTGKVVGDEVPQVYVSLGGPYDAKKVLRGFERLTVRPGKSVKFEAELTRRDVSSWDSASQNWVVSSYAKKVYVGNSSRNLPLSADLPL